MKCAKAEELMALAVEGDATATETWDLDRHLDTCAACRTFRRELEASQASLKSLAGDQVEAAVYAEIRARVLERLSEPRRLWWTSLFPQPRWQYALAAGLAVAVAALLFQPWQETGAPMPESIVELPEPVPEAAVPQHRDPLPVPPAVETPVEPASPVVAARTPTTTPEPPAVAAVAPPAVVREASALGELSPTIPGESASMPRPEPVVVKVVSDNPDIVIYWLVEPKEKANESFIG